MNFLFVINHCTPLSLLYIDESLLCKNVTLFSAFWEWHQTLGRTTVLPLSEKGCKMLIGLLARRWCKSPKTCVYNRYAERKPGLDKSQGCWRCIILYYPLISMYKKRYKRPFQTIEDGPVTGKTGFSCVFFTLFSGWIPTWDMEALWVYLLALASKTHVRGSLRQGTLRYSNRRQWPNIDGANLLFWGFISSPRKPSYSASFLH